MHRTNRNGGNEDSKDEDGVQFVTPYYEGSERPEPWDLSRLRLDDNYGSDDEEAEEEHEEEERYTRSRSRSIHSNDAGVEAYVIPSTEDNQHAKNPGHPPVPQPALSSSPSTHTSQSLTSQSEEAKNAGKPRTGPLQHREVVALQKGLEEANHNSNPFQTREDEEERMAADAEKRKRILAANNLSTLSSDPVRKIKILMLGDSGVGKSSLIMRWTLDTFSPSLVSTVGVNFKNRKVTYKGECIQVQVWDTAGQEHFHKITTSYYKGAQGIMVVYDVSDTNSLDNIEYWIKNIKSHASDSVQVALVGNKIDLRGDHEKVCLTPERGKHLAQKFGIPFYETSAKDSSNVNEAFLTLMGHIADITSPIKYQMHRTNLQGGLDRKNSPEADKISTKSGSTAIVEDLQPQHQQQHSPQQPNNSNISSSKAANRSNNSSAQSSPLQYAGNNHTRDPKEKCIIS